MQLTTRLRRGLAVLTATACALAGVAAFAPPATAASTVLIISEYIEGSSNNKALEIYNGTGAAINLSEYTLRVYFNGNSTAGHTATPSGTLAAGEVWVYAHASASATILAQADATVNAGLWNGDDAITLTKATP